MPFAQDFSTSPVSCTDLTPLCGIVQHGGGNRCRYTDCDNASRGSSGLCIRHGGGPRCIVPRCPKSARTVGGYCKMVRTGLTLLDSYKQADPNDAFEYVHSRFRFSMGAGANARWRSARKARVARACIVLSTRRRSPFKMHTQRHQSVTAR